MGYAGPMESPGGNVSVTDSDCQEKRPGILLDDRLWTVKLGLALGLLALLCGRAAREIGELYPDVDLLGGGFDHHRGKTVHAWAKPVLAARPDGFEIETRNGPLLVTGFPLAVRPDDRVSFTGRVVGPRHVAASVARINESFLWKRGLNYGLSSVTVVAFLWLVRRRFRWRLSEGVFRSRY